MRQRRVVASLVAAWGLLAAGTAAGQSLGTFSWQLQPFCNVVTVTVTQNGAFYTLDGYDNQCGNAQRAPLVGSATFNPDTSIGLGMSIVTVPGGLPVHVDARIALATLSGNWSDSAGNSGIILFNGPGGGMPRSAPTIPAFALAPGSIVAGHLAAGAVGTAAVSDGSLGAADVNAAQIQLRLNGYCPSGTYIVTVAASGLIECRASTTGTSNVALGSQTLQSSSATGNTAVGEAALRANTTGSTNTAVGQAALLNATTAQQNVAVGTSALSSLTTGPNNTAVGLSALRSVEVGGNNVAVGFNALGTTTSSSNTAVGYNAGSAVTSGASNVLIGNQAGLSVTTGIGNVAIGASAGTFVTAGSNNIHINNSGVHGDTSTIRIGAQGTQTRAFMAGVRDVTTATAAIPVLVSTTGQLGTVSSSRRYKDDIADMGEASRRLFDLRPVTFRYKQPMADGSRPLDYGLIAEEVAEVFPELAVHSADGQIETVAYHKLPALLLNEVQQQQREIETLRADVEELKRLLLRSVGQR